MFRLQLLDFPPKNFEDITTSHNMWYYTVKCTRRFDAMPTLSCYKGRKMCKLV